MNKIKCFIIGHKIEESSCPYTMRTYQTCIRCGSKGIKSEQ